MNQVWDTWKKGFDAWEGATAKLFESVLKSPLVLEPAGATLSATMKAKTARDAAVAKAWAALGLPTRRDQERILHALNQIQSRLLDLEEKLEDAARSESASGASAGVSRVATRPAPAKSARKSSKPATKRATKRAAKGRGALRLADDAEE